jgi:hypothetical protein
MVSGNRKAVLVVGACLLFLLLIVPFVSAAVDPNTIPVDTTPLAENNPELIAALKLHAACLGQSQEARMDGVIAYIDNISQGTGSANLEQIRDDYLVIAATIPLMTTNDEITKARDDMRKQTELFSDETNAQFVLFNGSTDDMRASINASMDAADASFKDFNNSLWLAKDSASLTLFNAESQQRALLLLNLDRQGIDTNLARNISDQIDAQRSNIQGALSDNSADALLTVNTGIKTLNRQFRKTVGDSQAAMAIELKRQALMAMK